MSSSLGELAVDVAVTAAQATEYYGLSVADVENAGGVSMWRSLRPAVHSRQPMETVLFVSLDEETASFSGHQLRHLAGTAAMRQVLQAPATAWGSAADAADALMVPDAVWESPEGPVAIEYDSGGYSRDVILEKGLDFARVYPGGQVWGVTGAHRTTNVRRLLLEKVDSCQVLHVPWC